MREPRFRLLVRLFTRRFFENDLLAPDIDLRPSAIWLLAALIAPGWVWAVKSMVRYSVLGHLGFDAIEAASWFDKSLLLMAAMANGAIVTVLSWEALLLDRRDAQILGGLPLPPRLVVAAKGLAVLRLFGVVAALNVPPILLFSLGAYGHFGLLLVLKAAVSQTVAASAATLVTCILLTAALVAVTSSFDGRWLRAMTVGVQVVVLVAVVALVTASQWAGLVAPAVHAGGPERLAGLVLWPPLWFLGLNQWAFGHGAGRELFAWLAARALVVAGVAFGAAVPVTLLLWRRALRALVAAGPGEAPGRRRSLASAMAARLAGTPPERALLQFVLTVLWRSARHRLAMLSAAGLAAALALQAVLVLAARPGGTRWSIEFAMPVLVLLALLAVLRWLLTLPAELPASWVMAMIAPVRGSLVRRAVHRALIVLAVVPAGALALALSWWQGGALSAIAHGILVPLAGLVLIERVLSRLTFLPFATEYLPGRTNLKARWPVHGVVLLVVVPTIAQVERVLLAAPGRAFAVVAALGAMLLALAVRRRRGTRDRLTADPGTGDEWTAIQLGLGGMAPGLRGG
ncbi:MAG TPA: hypothetical protein VF136_19980 [Methylomirabilota bacterium]